jgi:hypothetical protein
VVVNLVINARDVLPKGGRIIIETANIELDEEYFSGKFPVLKPGSYVMLAVRGVPSETLYSFYPGF